ncbi:MAG TPA: Ig-like domain-containing protein [Thermoanaerobaculia bacterium]|nr:Ig-like domain-containing protein [Thermoanaerobaculia bacterium]
MRATARLLVLCVGLLAIGSVEADEIASADLQIQGVGLRVITISASTGLDIPAVIQTEFGGKQNEEAQVVEGLLAVGELSGPGIDAPIRLETAPGHKFQIPGLSREGVYFLQNIRLMKGDDFLQSATPAVATITVSNLLQTSVRVRQLSAEEIRARGISIDPRNYEVYEYTFSFLVNGQIVEVPFPVVIDPRTHEARPIVEETPYRLPPVSQVLPPRWHPPDISTFELYAGDEQPEPVDDPVRRTGTGRPAIPAALIIPNNLAVLHQFFAVTLMVTNGAPSGSNVTLDAVTGQIKPPASLRTVKSNPSVSFNQPVPIVDATTGVTFLVAEAKGEVDWTMEGLQPGTHTVEVEVRATYKSPGQPDFPMRGSVRASVVVHDPRFNVTFSHPDTVRKDIEYSTYSFITNMSGAAQNIKVTNGVPGCAEAPGANVCRVDGTPATHDLEIPAGEMRSIEYKLKPGITGHVFATAGSVSDENITAAVQLHMGVSESGVPLSPATLVMPYYSRFVSQPMVSANLQLLGLGYSLATAPLTPALAKHPHIIKTDVFQRATDIARAGQRVFLGEDMRDALVHMSLDLLGNSRELAEWDELRRREKSGRSGAASIAREMETALGGGSIDSFASRFATATAWREPYLFALSSRGNVSVRSVASNARMDVASEASQGWVRQVPYGELTTFRDGELAMVGRFTGDYEVSVTPQADGPFSLDLILPAAEPGSVLHAQLQAAGTAGKKLTVLVKRGSSTLELRDSLGGIAAQASTQTVSPESLRIIGARQDLNLDPGGHKVSVLWNRPVAVAAGDDLLAKFAAEVVLNRDGIDFRGPRPMSAAALQEGSRVANVTFDHALSKNAEYSMTVGPLLDPLTGAPVTFNNPVVPVIDNDAPGGIIFGHVLKGDNTAIANAEVRLSLATIGAGPPQWDLSRSSDGAFLFEFVPRDVDNGLPGSYRLEATTEDGKTTSVDGSVRLPGRVHLVNLVFLGRGGAEGIVRYDNGQVVAEATVVVGSTMFGQFRTGVTGVDGRYSIEDLPVGPLTFTATDKDGNITYAASEIRTAGQVVQQDLSIFRRPFPGSGTVHGVVRRSDTGAAVPFAEIGVYSQGYGLFDGFTDVAGRFSYRVPVGFITVLAAEWTLSRENAAIDFDLAANEVKEVTLTLNVKPAEALVTLEGTVTREDPLHPGNPAFYQPVAGALVKIDKAQAVTADADGRYVFSSIPVSFTGKKIQAYDPLTKRTATTNVPQLDPSKANVLPIFIDTANGYGEGTIRVRLLNAAGFPVSGYRVFEPGFPPLGTTPLEAKPNGVYEMADVPVGAIVKIWAVGDGGSPYFDQTATGSVKVEFNGHVAALNLRLPGQGTVRTKLTADIDLIGDVKLTYPAWEEADMDLAPKEVVRNSSENGLPGFATFPNIPASLNFTVESLHPVHGYASKSGKIGFDGDVQSLTLQLDRLSTVRGVVYAIDGRTPIAGAAIRIEDGRQNQGVFFTQPDGSFQFFNVPAATSFRVIADVTQDGTYRTGVASGRTPNNGGPVDGVTVVMRTQGSLSGRIVYHGYKVFDPQNPANNILDDTPGDFTDNAPVPLANFILRELDFPYRSFGTTADPSSADAAGRFSFNNVFTGPLRITAFDPGNQEIRGTWTGSITTEGEEVSAIVTIGDDGIGTISIRVLDPNAQNAPVLNAEVLLLRNNAQFDLGSTDLAGRVQFEQVPATGTYRVNAYSKTLGKSGGSGSFTVAPNTTVEQTIVLEFSGKVEGTLTDPEAAGAGVPGAPVTLNAQSFLTRASTDAAGAFLFDGVREGLFKLEAKDTLTNRRATASRDLTQANPHLVVPLQLEPTETLYLNVYLPNDTGGNSNTLAPLVNIEVTQRNNDFKRSLQGNSFQMPGLLENERYTIKIQELGGSSRQLTITDEFPKGSSANPLNVVLQAYGSVETRVVQASSPAANAKVTVTGGGKTFVVYTDEAGIALANGIPLGSAFVQVVSSDKAFSGSTNVTVTSQSVAALAQITLGAFAGISGLVEAETGGPSVGTRVVASFSRILEMLTDSNGRFTFQGIPTGSTVSLTYLGPNDVTVGARQTVNVGAGAASQVIEVPAVRLDGTPPQVLSFFPADGSNNVSPDSTLRIVFTEPVQAIYVNTAHFQLLPADSSTPVATSFSSVTLGDGTFEVRMTPPAAPPGQLFPLKSNSLYRIIVSGEVRDLTGNKMPAPRGASFITSDYAEPKVLKVLPPETAALLPATTFEFRFNEPIDPLPWQPGGNGQFHLYKINAPGPGGSIVAEKPGRAFIDPASSLSLFFAPDDPIEQESFYRVVFSGVRDLQGNSLAQQTFHFFSYDLIKPFVTIVSPVPADFALISGVEYTLGVDLRNGEGGPVASDIAKVDYFRVDGGVASYLFTATASPWTYRFVGPDAPPTGSTLTLRAVATDLSTNVSDPADFTWPVKPNAAPQNVTVGLTPPTSIYPGNPAFASVTFEDEGVLATVQVEAEAIHTDGSEFKTSQVKSLTRDAVNAPWPAANFNFDLPGTLKQGTNAEFTATVTDVRGLKGTGSNSLALTVDDIAPEILSISPAAQTRYNIGQKFQISAVVKDLETGALEVVFAFDNQSIKVTRPSTRVVAGGQPGTWVFSSGEITVPAKNVDTTIPITVTAKDYNGNLVSRTTEVVYVGVNDPTVPKGAWLCPVEKAVYPAGAAVAMKLQARATDDIAITAVKFTVPGIADPIAATRVGTTDVYEALTTVTMPAAGESLTLLVTISDANDTHDITLPVLIDAVEVDETIDDRIQAVTPALAASYMNKSIVVRGAAGRFIPHVPLTLKNLIVLDGARVETLPTTTTVEQRLDLTITDRLYVDCASSIDVSSKGYLGGRAASFDGSGTNSDPRGRTVGNTSEGGASTFASASHAGIGGEINTGVTNAVYGSISNPTDLGSGGGGGVSTGNAGASGGGVVSLQAPIVAVAGSINASGGDRVGDGNAGAGGSINILASQFMAGPSARIRANGGDDDGSSNSSRGAGGGRIAITATDRLEVETFGVQVQARGGRNITTSEARSFLDGGAGTVFVRRPGQTLGELFVGGLDERFPQSIHLNRPTPLSGTLQFDRVALGPRALARADASLDIGGVIDDKAAATIDATAVLILNGELPAIATTTTPVPDSSIVQAGALVVNYTATSAAGVGNVILNFSPIATPRNDVYVNVPLSATPPSPVSLTVPATTVPGPATLLLTATDRAGRSFTAPALSFAIVENMPPVIESFVNVPEALYPGKSVVTTASASDDLRVTKLSFVRRIGTGTPTTTNFAPNTPTYTQNVTTAVPIDTPGGQQMTVDVTVEDAFPGRAPVTQTKIVQILLDTVAPAVSITQPANDALFAEGSGATIQVRASIVDAEVGIKEATVRIGTGAAVNLTKSGNDYVATIPVPSVDGVDIVTRTLTVTGKDYEGNAGTASINILIQPLNDPNGPVVRFACPTEGALYPAGFNAKLRVFALGNNVGNTANGVQTVEIFVGDSTAPIAATRVGTTDYFEASYAIPADAVAGSSVALSALVTNTAGLSDNASSILTIVSGERITADTTISPTNTTYDGKTVIVESGNVTVTGPHTFENLIIVGGRVIHAAGGRLELTVTGTTFVACDGAIDATDKGYGLRASYPGITASTNISAGSHIGRGGENSGTSGATYGSVYRPREAGGGAAHDGYPAGGGGVIRLITPALIVDGGIRANGLTAMESAGGSVWITADSIHGAGRIEADGSSGGWNAGGGGAIAVEYTSALSSFVTMSARTNNAQTTVPKGLGAPGSIYTRGPSSTYGDLVIDSGNIVYGQHTILPSLGKGTAQAGSGGATLVLPNVSFPFFEGHWVEISTPAGVLKNTWRIASVSGATVTLEPNGGEAVVVEPGDLWQGVYRFDTVRANNGEPLRSADPIRIGVNGIVPLTGPTAAGKVLEFAHPFSGTTVTVTGNIAAPEVTATDALTVKSGARLTPSTIAPNPQRIAIDAGTLTVEDSAAIDASGRGFNSSNSAKVAQTWPNVTPSTNGGGGSHGGRGGGLSGAAQGDSGGTYGSLFDPDTPGGAGATRSSACAPCGAGGGVVRLRATKLVLDGQVLVNGVATAFTGSGAGGSIRVDASSFSGAGLMRADGTGRSDFEGAGGGGRIAIYSESMTFDRSRISAAGGTHSDPKLIGSAGTIFLKSPTDAFGELILDNVGRNSTKTTPIPSVGYATVSSFDSDSVTDAAAQFIGPDHLRGARLVLNHDRSTTWPIVANTDKQLRVDVTGASLTAQAGQSMRGLYRLDRVTLRNAKLEIKDLLEVSTPIDKDASSSVLGNNQGPPLVNASLVALQSTATGSAVIGTAGAVTDADPAVAFATNVATGNVYQGPVNANGSFTVPVQGSAGDAITFKVRDSNAFPLESPVFPVGTLQASTPVPSQITKTDWATDTTFLARILSGDGNHLAVTSYPATNGASPRMTILSVADPAHPSFVRTLDVGISSLFDVVVSNGWAYISGDRLATLNLDDPAAVPNIANTNQGGWESSVALSGGYAFTSEFDWFNDARIHIYNVSTPSSPRYLRSQNMVGHGGYRFSDLIPFGSDYLIGLSYDLPSGVGRDVMVIDRRDIYNLKHVTTLDVANFNAFRGQIIGTNLYLVSRQMAELVVVSLANPAAPAVLGRVPLPAKAAGVSVLGGDAFVAAEPAGLVTVSVATPSAPAVSGANAVGGNAFDTTTVGQYVYVANELGIALVPAGIAPKIDLSRITMSLSGTMVTVSGAAQSITGTMPITVEVANVTTGASIDGLQVQADGSFSAMLPASPSNQITVKATDTLLRMNGPLSIGTVPFGAQARTMVISPAMADAAFLARNVSAHGNRAVVASHPPANSDKLVIFDVSTPTNPVHLRTVPSGASTVFDVVVKDGWLYFAADRFGTLNLSDPNATPNFSATNHGGWESTVEIVDGYAFTAEYDWFNDARIHIYEVVTPSAPRYLRSQNMVGHGGYRFTDLVAYGTDYLIGISPDKPSGVGRDVMVIDRRNISALRQVVQYDIPNFDGTQAKVVGTNLYVTGMAGGLAVVDLSNPAAPALKGILKTPGAPRALDALGTTLAVADSSAGATFVDTSPAGLPLILGNQPVGGSAWDSAFNGATLYLANESGLVVIDGLGTPPLIDRMLITTASNGATTATVAGSATSILGLGPLTVELRNATTGASVGGIPVASNGSFNTDIAAMSGHLLTIKATDAVGRASGPLSLGTVPFGSVTNHAPISTDMTDGAFIARVVSAHADRVVVTSYPPANSDKLVIFDVTTPGSPTHLRTVASTASRLFDVKVKDGWAYFAADRLGTLDLSNPAAAPNLANTNQGGWESSVEISGGYAFTSEYDWFNDARIHIYDVSVPSSPRYLRSQNMVGHGGYRFTDLVAFGTDYLIGISSDKPSGIGRDVMVIDRRDIYNMKQIVQFDIPNFDGFRANVLDNRLYVAGVSGGVAIVDLSNPSAPVLVSTVTAAGAARAIEIAGSTLAVANGTNGISFIDAGTSPLQVIGAHPIPGSAWDVSLSRGAMYVAGELGLTAVANVALPPMLDESKLTMTPAAASTTVTGAAQALTGITPITTRVDNVTTGAASPAAPVNPDGSFSATVAAIPGQALVLAATDVAGRVSTRKLPPAFGSTTTHVANQVVLNDPGYRARRIASDGNVSVASTGSRSGSGLGSLSSRMYLFRQPDASEPPQIITTTAGGVQDVEISSGYLYIAGDRLGTINLTNPALTTNLANTNQGGGEGAVAISGSYAFTSETDWFNDGRIHIYNISNPDSPVYVRSQGVSGVSSFNFDGLLALGTSYLIGLSPDRPGGVDRDVMVIDRTNLNSLVKVAEIPIPNFDAYDGVIDGTTLYVAGGDGGVAIIDLTNPLAPVLRSVINTPGVARGVAISGPDEIVVADAGGPGITFVNVADKTNPLIIGSQKVAGNVVDVKVIGKAIYVAGDNHVHIVMRP